MAWAGPGREQDRLLQIEYLTLSGADPVSNRSELCPAPASPRPLASPAGTVASGGTSQSALLCPGADTIWMAAWLSGELAGSRVGRSLRLIMHMCAYVHVCLCGPLHRTSCSPQRQEPKYSPLSFLLHTCVLSLYLYSAAAHRCVGVCFCVWGPLKTSGGLFGSPLPHSAAVSPWQP